MAAGWLEFRSLALDNVALRLQLREELTTQKLLWDGETCASPSPAAANQFLKAEYRQGRTL